MSNDELVRKWRDDAVSVEAACEDEFVQPCPDCKWNASVIRKQADELEAKLAGAALAQGSAPRPEPAPASNRTNGWDERDYKLWSEIRSLNSYGLIASDTDNPMLSRKEVLRLLEVAAEKRFNNAHH